MSATSSESIGSWMHSLARVLYPICRSITGDGVRATLRRLSSELPLEVREVPSGTEVFDWVVPEEWNVREAWIKDPAGNRIVDFAEHNLHLLGYSAPIHGKVSLTDLKAHLFSLPEQPDLIPYRTSYYRENWGFCVTHKLFESLGDGEYEVFIDSSHTRGSLTYGEFVLPGRTREEVLISCHVCHPSLANDNLAGNVVSAALAKHLMELDRRLTYRFLLIPGTIGSIAWLALNENKVCNIKHGLVITCAGDPGRVTYKETRDGGAPIDRAMKHVLKTSGDDYRIAPFHPYGYDERQFSSPGFNLAIGGLMRSQHGTFPEYHTSADNLEFIRPEYLADTLAKAILAIEVLEHNATYLNLKPKCEPRLGKYGLYGGSGGQRTGDFDELALLWVLNQSDGTKDLLAIAEKADMPFRKMRAAAVALENVGLLKRIQD